MTPLAPTVWKGFYFDGRGAGRHAVTITVAIDGLHIRLADGSLFWWPYRGLHQTQGFYPGEHARFEKGEGSPEALVVPEAGFLESIRQVAPEAAGGFGRPERSGFRWQLLIAVGGASILILLGFYFWVVPFLADFAAQHVSVAWEEKIGEATIEEFAPSGLRCEDPERLRQLNQVIARLVGSDGAAPYRIRLTVVNDDTVNAMAAPGGYVLVYSGLLKKTASAEELAGVLAHEIEHVRLRHGTKGMFRQLSMGVLISLVAGDSSGLATALQGAGTLGALRYNRQDELAADRGGMMMIERAHVDPKGMMRFFETLKEETKTDSAALKYLSSHPPTDERIESLRVLAAGANYAPTPLLPGQSWKEVTRICEANQAP